MKNIISLILSILLFSIAYGTVYAADTLSGNDIQHFIDAFRPVQELEGKYDFNDEEEPAEDINPEDFTPMTYVLELMKNHESYDEFTEIILSAGFSSPQQWAEVGDRVMNAYTAIRIIEEMTPKKIQKMLKSIEEVKKNEYLSPEIKKQLLESLTQMVTISDNLTEGEIADQEALTPYLDRLELLFKEK